MTEAPGAHGGLSTEAVATRLENAEQDDKNALPAFLTWALPEGTCDIPPCSLYCIVMYIVIVSSCTKRKCPHPAGPGTFSAC